MKALFARITSWVKTHKKISIAVGSVLGLVILIGGAVYLLRNQPWMKRTITETKAILVESKPLTKPSPLSGVEVKPELAERHVTAVVIENHGNSRPQSGLSEAGVVYEALAEGGITRFLAFYLENRPAVLGPIRSVRTYFVDWALEFDAPVAHVGGNADAMDLIVPLNMKNLELMVFGSSMYRANDRFAPHNAYSTSDLLDGLIATRGFNTPATFKPSPRKKDTPPTVEKPASNAVIKVNYSYPNYAVEYRYDQTSNDYVRYMAGAPHIDRNTGQQIRVKNIVVQYMPTSYGLTRTGEQTVIMATPGSGNTIVFRDGGHTIGTWSKSTHRERTKLLDAAGADIPLNAGNTWYSVVPTGQSVTY